MAKFYGVVGYGETVETPAGSGKWVDVITERNYYGDILNNIRRFEENQKVNDDLSLSNSISVLADAYALNHFFAIQFVEWAGALWTVNTVEVERPRLILRLGGVYNGPRAS